MEARWRHRLRTCLFLACVSQRKIAPRKKKKLKQKAAEAAGESVFMDYEKKKEVGEKAGKGE